MRSLGLLVLAALAMPVLAGPALADGGPVPRAHYAGWSGHGRHTEFRHRHHRHHHAWDRRRWAAPSAGLVGPGFYAWPDPASVRGPIYNRPLDPPIYD